MKDPPIIETWRCPLCHLTIGLTIPAHGPPTCPHGGTPRHASRPVLMIRVEPGGDAA